MIGVHLNKELEAARIYDEMAAEAEEVTERQANRQRLTRRGRDHEVQDDEARV